MSIQGRKGGPKAPATRAAAGGIGPRGRLSDGKGGSLRLQAREPGPLGPPCCPRSKGAPAPDSTRGSARAGSSSGSLNSAGLFWGLLAPTTPEPGQGEGPFHSPLSAPDAEQGPHQGSPRQGKRGRGQGREVGARGRRAGLPPNGSTPAQRQREGPSLRQSRSASMTQPLGPLPHRRTPYCLSVWASQRRDPGCPG